MRLVRVRLGGQARWGRLDGDDVHVMSGSPTDGDLEETARIRTQDADFLAPVDPTKIFCVGRNYAEHAREMNYNPTTAPSVFMKPLTALVAPGENVVLPPTSLSTHVEHEAELAVVIRKRARNISESDVPAHLLGITGANDVTARDLQRDDPQITRAKGFDTFCPVGPWIETEFDIHTGVNITSHVNGELRQTGNSTQMTYSIPFLVSFLSQFATLLPGDLILTGSPGGSGPLRPGDQYEQFVEGVGVLRHGVIAAPAR